MIHGPMSLRPVTYPLAEKALLYADPNARSALQEIHQTTTLDDLNAAAYDYSLQRQLTDVSQTTNTPEPDCYLFTAYSAIPVADAIRGFYNRRSMSIPILGYVHANRETSREYSDEHDKVDTSEVLRLRRLIQGLRHVCVIDQYCSTKATVLQASHMALAAGAQRVSAIQGKWYEDLTIGEAPDLAQLTSSHAPFFQAIGQTIADAAVGVRER